MKITDVEAVGLSCPFPEERRPLWYGPKDRTYCLVKVSTDEGITGWGQAGVVGYPEIGIMIEETLKPIVVGENPLYIQKIWDKMHHDLMGHGRRGAEAHAISGVDIALWDILGKACGKPIYQLLGGSRDEVKVYGSDPTNYSFHEERGGVAKYLDKGFRAFMCGIGPVGKHKNVEEAEEFVKSFRDSVGDDIELGVTATEHYVSHTAPQKIARRIEKYDISFFKEPINEHDYAGLAALGAMTTIPIMVGSHHFNTFEIVDLMAIPGVDIIATDVTNAGISELFKIAAMARARGKFLGPHCGDSPIGMAATMHVLAAISNAKWLEYHLERYDIPLRLELLKEPKNFFEVRDGWIKVPQGPGLGVEISEEALEKFAWKMY